MRFMVLIATMVASKTACHQSLPTSVTTSTAQLDRSPNKNRRGAERMLFGADLSQTWNQWIFWISLITSLAAAPLARTPDYRENTLIPRRGFLSGQQFENLSGLHLAEKNSPRFVRTWVSSCFPAKFCPDWLIWPNFRPESRLGILEFVGHVVEFVCVHRSESIY